MAREIEIALNKALSEICGGGGRIPNWLIRPGRTECGNRWTLVKSIYNALTGGVLPEAMPSRERRNVDGIFQFRGRPFILELDETQHFNEYRAITLEHYPSDLRLGFSPAEWLIRSRSKNRLEGRGFAKPKPPLFPGPNGRHRQRAFRDALTDLLPGQHGWLPTLRIGDFEVRDWIFEADAHDRVRHLLEERLEP